MHGWARVVQGVGRGEARQVWTGLHAGVGFGQGCMQVGGLDRAACRWGGWTGQGGGAGLKPHDLKVVGFGGVGAGLVSLGYRPGHTGCTGEASRGRQATARLHDEEGRQAVASRLEAGGQAVSRARVRWQVSSSKCRQDKAGSSKHAGRPAALQT